MVLYIAKNMFQRLKLMDHIGRNTHKVNLILSPGFALMLLGEKLRLGVPSGFKPPTVIS